MKRAILTILALSAPLHELRAVETPTQTAFFCLLLNLDVGGVPIGRPQQLSILLPGHPDDPKSSYPVLTYDPNSLLASEKFVQLFAGPVNSPGYMLLTRSIADNSGFMLSLTPKDGEPGTFDAGLGRRSSGPKMMGQCFGPVAPMDEQIFLEESKKASVE